MKRILAGIDRALMLDGRKPRHERVPRRRPQKPRPARLMFRQPIRMPSNSRSVWSAGARRPRFPFSQSEPGSNFLEKFLQPLTFTPAALRTGTVFCLGARAWVLPSSASASPVFTLRAVPLGNRCAARSCGPNSIAKSLPVTKTLWSQKTSTHDVSGFHRTRSSNDPAGSDLATAARSTGMGVKNLLIISREAFGVRRLCFPAGAFPREPGPPQTA